MRKFLLLSALSGAALLTGGCVSTVSSVATAPFKVAGKAVDWTTTSRDESDRNYGRKMRKQEAREGKQRREHDKKCRKDPGKCGEYDGYRARPDY